jgi:hypothetical protein
MTKNKAQKQAIRGRMAKTGEHYTTARHYFLDLHRSERGDATSNSLSSSDEQPDADLPAPVPAEEVEAPSALADQAPAPATKAALPPRVAEPGVSDSAVQRATGRDWDEWFTLLDAWDGTAHTHTEIARHVNETYGIDGWWAQSVTVGYERARGMRALHERPDGFSANASKTLPVPVDRLFSAFVDQNERERWLEGVELRPRTSQPPKSARFDVLPGETRLAITFVAKGPEKSSAQLQLERLAGSEEVARWKAFWKEQLARLADVLADEPATR